MRTKTTSREGNNNTTEEASEIMVMEAIVPVEVAAKDEGKDETLKKLECED